MEITKPMYSLGNRPTHERRQETELARTKCDPTQNPEDDDFIDRAVKELLGR
jgi:hypothetical protein